MKIPTICYKTKEPVYYNKGTKWEKTCSDFLFMEVHGDISFARQKLMEYNKMLDSGVEKCNGLDFTKVSFFYINMQEEMY